MTGKVLIYWDVNEPNVSTNVIPLTDINNTPFRDLVLINRSIYREDI